MFRIFDADNRRRSLWTASERLAGEYWRVIQQCGGAPLASRTVRGEELPWRPRKEAA